MFVFLTSIGILGFLTVLVTGQHFEVQLKKKIEHEANQLLVDYNQDGIDELWHDIKERITLDQTDRLLYSLIYNQNSRDFDKFKIKNTNPGWQTHEDKEKIIIYIVALPSGEKLAVASQFKDIKLLQKAITNNYIFVILIVLFIALCGGLFLSQRYVKRINEIRSVALKIGQGDLKSRIPVYKSNDQFDDIALIINSMIDQIEVLVSEVQRVSSNIAHELRTPLGHLRQKIEFLSLNESMDEVANENIKQALEDIDNTLRIFKAILRLSEIKVGSRKSNFIRFNLSQLIIDICESYEIMALESNKILNHKITNNKYTIGDPSFIRQLIVNLIENSIEHTTTGTQISIELKNTEKNKIILIIKDNGPGIENIDEAKKPFTKFSRKTNHGAGLGLAIIDEIANLHNFKINFINDHGLKIEIIITES